MKKLIFLLFPVFSYGQITSITSSSGYNTAGFASITPGMIGGKLYLLFIGTSNAGGTPATVSIAGTGQTWTELVTAGGVVNATSGKRLQVFMSAPASNNANATNFTYTGVQDGGFVIEYEITGAKTTGTNGADAIVQAVGGQANTANPNASISSLQTGASMIFALINDANHFGGTPESGWTESEDGGYATPNTGGYGMYRINTTDNTPTVTAASSNWAGIAIELKPAVSRRAAVIN